MKTRSVDLKQRRTLMKISKPNTQISVTTIFFEASYYDISANINIWHGKSE